jgi:UDP-N-acetylglucosamine--N-acetylmuramyl-(pentapeptide) pyrophosphoryl-undecaprenol N-acetylglucosamine transferase
LYMGFPEAIATLPEGARASALHTGNPISPPPNPRPDREQCLADWKFNRHLSRVLLIFGGSQGSRAINDAVAAWLPGGVPDGWGVIWVTGRSEFERFQHYATDSVRVVPYQQPMADAYAVADLAIARAGAMSTAELCAWGIPMLLIPLPTAAADHQSHNARALASAGAAINVPQSTLVAGALGTSIATLLAEPTALTTMRTAAHDRAHVNAAREIAARIIANLGL